jgi:hypothetical protein
MSRLVYGMYRSRISEKKRSYREEEKLKGRREAIG